MRKLLTIVVCVLLVCALTTSLLQKDPPSFAKVMDKASKLDIDVEYLVASINDFDKYMLEYQDTDGLDMWEKIEAYGWNIWVEIYNTCIGLVSGSLGVILFVESCLHGAFAFLEIAVYLLTGIEVEMPERLT